MLNGKYTITKPGAEYTSMYGYQKNRLAVVGESGDTVGYIKEEIVLDEAGDEASRIYYTRNGWRPSGAKRFFASPEALVIAYGGQIDRTKKKAATTKPARPAANKKKPRAGKKPGRVKKAA